MKLARKNLTTYILIFLVILGLAFIYFTIRAAKTEDKSTPIAGSFDAVHPFRSAAAKEQYLKRYNLRAAKWPVASEERLVTTSYGQTLVRISGPINAPPLVLLPQAGGNSLGWAPNIEALSREYRTYAVDNIYDHGKSVYTRTIDRPDDYIDWLDELFMALSLDNNINLMGVSYGGWLTSQYALHKPNGISKIVLIAPAATVLPVRTEFWGRAMLASVLPNYFSKSFLHWLAADLVRKDEGGRMLADEAAEDLAMGMRCFKPKRMPLPTVLKDQELQSLSLPVLYLVGENEKLCSAQDAVQRLNKVAPQIKTEVVPDAGHDLAVVQAEMVNRKIVEFLKQP